jgi:hypothetical protein
MSAVDPDPGIGITWRIRIGFKILQIRIRMRIHLNQMLSYKLYFFQKISTYSYSFENYDAAVKYKQCKLALLRTKVKTIHDFQTGVKLGVGSGESRILIRIDIRARICKLFKSPGIDSKKSILPACSLVVVPARQATYIGWRNRFLDSLNVYKFGLGCRSGPGSEFPYRSITLKSKHESTLTNLLRNKLLTGLNVHL